MEDYIRQLNLSVLKRIDPCVKNILTSSKQVALYSFSTVKEKWETTDISGALFVYMRHMEPCYNVIILNRLNRKNFIVPILKEVVLLVKPPYLLYCNNNQIFGIWFYDRYEYFDVTTFMINILEFLVPKREKESGQATQNILTEKEYQESSSKFEIQAQQLQSRPKSSGNITHNKHFECTLPVRRAHSAPSRLRMDKTHCSFKIQSTEFQLSSFQNIICFGTGSLMKATQLLQTQLSTSFGFYAPKDFEETDPIRKPYAVPPTTHISRHRKSMQVEYLHPKPSTSKGSYYPPRRFETPASFRRTHSIPLKPYPGADSNSSHVKFVQIRSLSSKGLHYAPKRYSGAGSSKRGRPYSSKYADDDNDSFKVPHLIPPWPLLKTLYASPKCFTIPTPIEKAKFTSLETYEDDDSSSSEVEHLEALPSISEFCQHREFDEVTASSETGNSPSTEMYAGGDCNLSQPSTSKEFCSTQKSTPPRATSSNINAGGDSNLSQIEHLERQSVHRELRGTPKYVKNDPSYKTILSGTEDTYVLDELSQSVKDFFAKITPIIEYHSTSAEICRFNTINRYFRPILKNACGNTENENKEPADPFEYLSTSSHFERILCAEINKSRKSKSFITNGTTNNETSVSFPEEPITTLLKYLMQALKYLLKTDPEIAIKLHKAYEQYLSEMLKYKNSPKHAM